MFLQKSEKVEHPTVLGKTKDSPPIAKPKKVVKTPQEKRMGDNIGSLTGDALNGARQVEMNAKKLTESITVQPSNGSMEIKMVMTNKKETPDLRLHTPPPAKN
jgi:hypothetical protein